MRSKQLLINSILLVFGLGLGLVALEVSLRIWHQFHKGEEFEDFSDIRSSIDAGFIQNQSHKTTLRDLFYSHPNDRLIFDLKPNLDLIFQGVPVRTNSCGLRGPERPIAKPPNTVRIALLGDSFVFGWGVEQGKIFAQVMEDSLNSLSRGQPNFEVLNLGVPGYSTFQEVERFKTIGLDFDPDIALVYFIDNDFGLPFFVRDIERPGGLLSSVEFVDVLRRQFTPELRKEKSKFFNFEPNKALKEFADLCLERGIKPFLTINPSKSSAEHRKKLWILNRRDDIRFFDFRDDLLRYVSFHQIAREDLSLPDDPHPSALKHEILGRLLATQLLEYVPQKQARTH